jgi:two-component system CheB/CheR fusion protein
MTAVDEQSAFGQLVDFVKHSRGFDFTGYKRSSLERRVKRRMNLVRVETFEDYQNYLENHQEEFNQLFNSILINVTSFYRDSNTWEYLQNEIIPNMLANKLPDEVIRVWIAGCASGEETYTLVMCLAEVMGKAAFLERVKIYATDIDEDALNHARAGVYGEKDLSTVPNELVEKYFECTTNGYMMRKEYRRAVIFGRHDLVQDAPISRADLLICRNVIMYLNPDTQAKILTRLHFALNEGGYLFLGKAEMLLTHTDLFRPVDLRMRIFTRVAKGSILDREKISNHANQDISVSQLLSQVKIRTAAFDASPMAQIVVDNRGTLILANAKAREQFGLATSDLGHPFQDFQLSYRPAELRSVIEQVLNGKVAILRRDIEWINSASEDHLLEVEVTPISEEPNGVPGVSISFMDVTYQKHLQQQLENSNQELETTNEELQSTNEELETTNEELQSTVEELETTNEELQSTNEELETMNEELQSTNEELETLNDELRRNTNQLNQVNGYLESILASLRGGVVVLDQQLQIQIWNEKSEELWGLRSEEVHGTNFFNLDIGLPVDQLHQPVRAILTGETACQDVDLLAVNRRGKQIMCHASCSPLFNSLQQITGVILVVIPNEAG